MDKYVGKKLDGRYEIRELIGIGGMANVYRCYDTIDDREVAIKILKDEFLNNEEFIRRFKNESKAIAVLSHPNIVKVYDVSFGDMIQYIVMEYIDGITLKEYINQQKVLTWKETVHMITQILAALSHAHSKGVVHRDIKPQNMMLLSDGTIKVTDFGIARFSNSTRTMTEQAIGSVHYIAPEQAKGDITDGKTDIYSVGVMMYEMLTGKLPFDGENAVSVALMHLQIVPESPRTINPSIPEGIEEITVKAMQKQPADRYQSAQDMLSDIDRFRMNPSVRFEYKYLYDKQPTKYIDAVNKGKSHRAEEYAQTMSKEKDEEKVRHSLTIPIIAGILIALCIALVICIPMGIFKNSQADEAEDVEIPNFIGKNIQEVIENPEYKFNFELDYVYTDEDELHTILDQKPAAGSKKIKSNGTITLTINSAQGEQSVPAIYGLHESAARSALGQSGFYQVSVIKVSDANAAEDTVVRSYPEQGTVTSLTETIYLYVADGAAQSGKIEVRNVIGYTKEDAISSLEGAGFKVIAEEVDSDKAKDVVVSQAPLGGKLDKGSTVTIYVSKETPENSVTISVELPENVNHSMDFTIIGEDIEKTFSVYSSSKVQNFSVTGRGSTTVQILLDGQLYREYRVDFTNKDYETLAANNYVDTNSVETQPDSQSSDGEE